MYTKSGLDFIFSLKHIIDLRKIICSLCESFRVALGAEILLQMSLLSKHAHLSCGQHAMPNNGVVLGRPTSSYVSGGTVLLASSRSCKSRLLAIELTSPCTLKLNKELARPLP